MRLFCCLIFMPTQGFVGQARLLRRQMQTVFAEQDRQEFFLSPGKTASGRNQVDALLSEVGIWRDREKAVVLIRQPTERRRDAQNWQVRPSNIETEGRAAGGRPDGSFNRLVDTFDAARQLAPEQQ